MWLTKSHACIRPGVYKADENYQIVDIDVASYYPNLAIKNNFYPEHLGEEFCEIYSDIYDDRKVAKHSGDKVTDAGLKLALNGTYGKSNDKYSFLYDPQFTMKITINGQLLLSMLSEELAEISTILQVNTDGVTIKIHNDNIEKMKQIIKDWEDLTQLELEDAYYSQMIIRDVNNYMAVYTNGKIKYKGAFEIDKEMKGELQYHKDHSSRIVPIAVMNYFVNGVSVVDTIKNHLTNSDYNGTVNHGIFDFMIGKRTRGGKKGAPKMILRRIKNGELEDEILQKTNRYYISTNGGHLIKRYDDGSISTMEAHPQRGRMYKINVMNDFKELEDYNIDYTYYIREANKMINQIEPQNYSLF